MCCKCGRERKVATFSDLSIAAELATAFAQPKGRVSDEHVGHVIVVNDVCRGRKFQLKTCIKARVIEDAYHHSASTVNSTCSRINMQLKLLLAVLFVTLLATTALARSNSRRGSRNGRPAYRRTTRSLKTMDTLPTEAPKMMHEYTTATSNDNEQAGGMNSTCNCPSVDSGKSTSLHAFPTSIMFSSVQLV